MAILGKMASGGRLLGLVAAGASLLAPATGCAARAVNNAIVFKEVTGVIQMEVKVPAGEAFARVQFQVNDKVVTEDDDPSDGYKAEIDTANLEVDVLAKIAAVGVRADGSTTVLRENFILIGQNPANADDPASLTTGNGTAGDGNGKDDAVGGTTSYRAAKSKGK